MAKCKTTKKAARGSLATFLLLDGQQVAIDALSVRKVVETTLKADSSACLLVVQEVGSKPLETVLAKTNTQTFASVYKQIQAVQAACK